MSNAQELQAELSEWLESLDYVLAHRTPAQVLKLLQQLQTHAAEAGVGTPFSVNTPYINTISRDQQPPYPGSREIERRIKSIVRWNAMAMVVRANHDNSNLGGHISTYASSATLYEVGYNHFFRAPSNGHPGDQIYFQGHASPGMYARAFLEGRLNEHQLENFRRELQEGGGLASYPHPWLMPDFWQFPTVSMGLGPILSIYQARFNRYLENRDLKPVDDSKVWAFLGDGECDEPESLGALTLAAREQLNNLIWVVNCNLQRLDGPVRGNGKIIQELEAVFRGAGWNVVKVIWGDDWDPLLEQDADGSLAQRMNEVVDGQYQKYSVSDGSYIRHDFFGTNPKLAAMVEHHSDEQLQKMRRGGHDPEKVYAAYQQAIAHKSAPTVILAKTIKGYGMGEAGEGKNITHQQKKLNEDEIRLFRTRFGIPISDEEVAETPFYRPPDDSPEMQYIRQRRESLGGYVPQRQVMAPPLAMPPDTLWEEFKKSSGKREFATTMAFVAVMRKLMQDKQLGKFVVPIVPDESRTFGMEPLFRQFGIYSSLGQLYEPVDKDVITYYKEAKDGQILEEGITEAGSMSSFIAAGSAYATHGINTIPFFIYYSMFGMQRIGDLVWLAGDMRVKGFMVGGTAGRTTLNGEGLQHEDGHSHLLAYPSAQSRSLRSGLWLRNRRHHPRGHSPHVRRAGGRVLLPDGRKRHLPHAGNARRRRRRHSQGHVQVQALGQEARPAQGPPLRQRRNHQQCPQSTEPARRKVPSQRGCLEHHQLQGPAPRRARCRALEPPASRRKAPSQLHRTMPRQGARRTRHGLGLRQGPPGIHRPLVSQPAHLPRHRWLWPQREPRGPARPL